MDADQLKYYDMPDAAKVAGVLAKEAEASSRKIIVLDDDPTGVQTVHDVSVYTDWSIGSMRKGFAEKGKLFFILTNSRGFTEEQTTKAHLEIAAHADLVSKEFQMDYIIINRGDSTLRGHYPLETALIRKELEKRNTWKIDAEILCPYFKEGGRYTIDDVHYVKDGDELIPAGETEFARDETFGYRSSNLCEYVVEKTGGVFQKEDCVSIPLSLLRSLDYGAIKEILIRTKGFRKIIVNAIDDVDVKIFCTALYGAMAKGCHYTVRCAAAFVKALGNISDKPLLTHEEMMTQPGKCGGIIVVGSHTAKTTAQLEELKKIKEIVFLELDSDLVLETGKLEQEAAAVIKQEEVLLSQGKTVCISTKRTLLKVRDDTPEEALKRSVRISDALQSCVGKLNSTPGFVVAKGGITSSDVATKALGVTCARVLGQIQPGIPVWQTGSESRFPGTPYVIFPGNVGETDTLRRAVEILLKK